MSAGMRARWAVARPMPRNGMGAGLGRAERCMIDSGRGGCHPLEATRRNDGSGPDGAPRGYYREQVSNHRNPLHAPKFAAQIASRHSRPHHSDPGALSREERRWTTRIARQVDAESMVCDQRIRGTSADPFQMHAYPCHFGVRLVGSIPQGSTAGKVSCLCTARLCTARMADKTICDGCPLSGFPAGRVRSLARVPWTCAFRITASIDGNRHRDRVASQHSPHRRR
jgi:hypothetical protein